MKNLMIKYAAVALTAAVMTFCAPAQSVCAAPAEAEQIVLDANGQPVDVTPALSAPTVMASTIGYQSATLMWDVSEYAVKYALQQSTDNKTFKTIATRKPGQELRFVAEGLYTKQAYYYRVIAKSAEGKTVKSKSLKVTPALASPVVTQMEQKDPTHVSIAWTDVEGADFYRVYRSKTKVGGYKRIKAVYTNTYEATVTPGVTYYYKIIALHYNPDGKKVQGKASAAQSVVTVEDPAVMLNAPGNMAVKQDGSGNVTISWSPSRTGAVYQLYRLDGSSGIYQQIAADLSECTYTDKGLTIGETYQYQVEASCDGLTSAMSDPVSVTIGTIKFNTRTLFLGPGVSALLTATSELPGKITFRSKDPAVASVSADGTVIGVGQGKTTVYAAVNDLEVGVSVTVTDALLNGIDVSKWQQAINWETVKASGIRFAMLRLAHGTSKDIQFENYYSGAMAQGIPVGIYCYTLAKSVDEGVAEAEYLLELLEGKELAYPIALDLESDNQIKNMNKAARTELILAYKRIIEEAGYQFVVYANLNWLNNYIDQTKLEEENVDIWIARYCAQSLGHRYEGGGNVRMWQYSSTGQVDGILDAYGRYINVDLDVCYDGY
ncbi:MAG: GH25 family lysozyme [bacterium]|nr:GH25 family lysozyme [bacterium]MDY4100620.1 GH25 family lysozyme [Lachnospiraceae bacterium]